MPIQRLQLKTQSQLLPIVQMPFILSVRVSEAQVSIARRYAIRYAIRYVRASGIETAEQIERGFG